MQNRVVSPESSEDARLVAAAQAGDVEAFSALAARHRSLCMKLAISVLHEREDAEDEVQNSLLKAYRHIGQFHSDSKFSTWLSRIVINQCLMRVRQTRRARLLPIDEQTDDREAPARYLAADGPSPEEMLGASEIAALLAHEVRRIPPLLRKTFLMRDVEGQPMPNVAAELGISVAAAKSRLLRARSELRERLQRHCGRMGLVTLHSAAR